MIRVGELPKGFPQAYGASQRFCEIFISAPFRYAIYGPRGPFFGHWKKHLFLMGVGMQLPLATPRFSHNWLDL